jgi:hypothetical protein
MEPKEEAFLKIIIVILVILAIIFVLNIISKGMMWEVILKGFLFFFPSQVAGGAAGTVLGG